MSSSLITNSAYGWSLVLLLFNFKLYTVDSFWLLNWAVNFLNTSSGIVSISFPYSSLGYNLYTGSSSLFFSTVPFLNGSNFCLFVSYLKAL